MKSADQEQFVLNSFIEVKDEVMAMVSSAPDSPDAVPALYILLQHCRQLANQPRTPNFSPAILQGAAQLASEVKASLISRYPTSSIAKTISAQSF
jgi:hypothetical protein